MINNPKTARIIATIVIVMMVLTLAAALFGCSATTSSSSTSDTNASGTRTSETRTSAGKDPYSGVAVEAPATGRAAALEAGGRGTDG